MQARNQNFSGWFENPSETTSEEHYEGAKRPRGGGGGGAGRGAFGARTYFGQRVLE